MWHSLVLVLLCLVTNWFQWRDVTVRWPYLILWGSGLSVWADIFWNLRSRSGPVTFVERQIAHVWAGSVIGSTGLYVVEWLLDLHVLQLFPVLGLLSGMVFLVKAGILSGAFYGQAVVLFLTVGLVELLQHISKITDVLDVSILIFRIVSAGCFLFPDLKYYRQRNQDQGNLRIENP